MILAVAGALALAGAVAPRAARSVVRRREGVTLEELRAIMPRLSLADARLYLPHLNAALLEADVRGPLRQAAFLAQIALESLELTAWEEFASGDAYEGRANLGNTQPGDGRRYKGRGPPQLTGRFNYRRAGEALGLPLEERPELAARVDVGFRVAGWYWASRDLNRWADLGTLEGFDEITRRVNGGYNGREQRRRYYAAALRVLSGSNGRPERGTV